MNTINVGILGLGTVGAGVLTILRQPHPDLAGLNFRVTRAAVRHVTAAREQKYPEIALTTEPQSIVTDPHIQVVVEVMGGVESTWPLLKTALTQGKHVITANKDLIAQHGDELSTIARAHSVALFYEAAVMGGVPILHTLTHTYANDRIHRLVGIANGTSNFILSQMHQAGRTYQEALTLAQQKGFAEADPTNDVAGIDAAYKLTILARLAFGVHPSAQDINCQGIAGLSPTDFTAATHWHQVIKPLIVADQQQGSLALTVSPFAIPQNHPLSRIDNENNGIVINSANFQEMLLAGPGAGALPTAGSVIADLATVGHAIQAQRVPVFAPLIAAGPSLLPPEAYRAQRFLAWQGSTLPDTLPVIDRQISANGIIYALTQSVSVAEVRLWQEKYPTQLLRQFPVLSD
ncbi:homoserine dehydrogenase [Schleiferilactobacillus perolens]|jgi:homoserine dehydrogenase|uniref:homoserine dehydrogenase n=1 Tax=Schleiferilactobacillus perolens TaxID=100468 RepID=UPI002357F461|nr:homoserine dehydrogenase [Schleiferilactobacillus perolens]MCI2171189.1 homoserine dehydrogenase [Schleiferilactobacillus perolens]